MKRAKRMSLVQGKAKDYHVSMHVCILIALLNSLSSERETVMITL